MMMVNAGASVREASLGGGRKGHRHKTMDTICIDSLSKSIILPNSWVFISNFIGLQPKCDPMKYLQAVLARMYLLGNLVLIYYARLHKETFVSDGRFLNFSTPLRTMIILAPLCEERDTAHTCRGRSLPGSIKIYAAFQKNLHVNTFITCYI